MNKQNITQTDKEKWIALLTAIIMDEPTYDMTIKSSPDTVIIKIKSTGL